MRTIAVEEEDLRHVRKATLQDIYHRFFFSTYIKLINERINRGLVAGQVLRRRHGVLCRERKVPRRRVSQSAGKFWSIGCVSKRSKKSIWKSKTAGEQHQRRDVLGLFGAFGRDGVG